MATMNDVLRGDDPIPYEDEYDGPVSCAACNERFPASALMGSGLCGDCEIRRNDDELDALRAQYEVDAADYWELGGAVDVFGGVVSDADLGL